MADIAGSRSGPYLRPPALWSYTLEGAESEREVVLAVREYLATWGPSELSRIPEHCRPGKVADAEDISDLAYRLTTCHLEFKGSLADKMLIEKLMCFVANAAARAAQLRPRAADELQNG